MNSLKLLTLSIFLILFSLGQLQRIELGGNIAIYVHDILIVFWLVFVFVKNKLWKKLLKLNFNKIYASYRLEFLFIIWIFVGFIFSVKNHSFSYRSLLYLLRILSYILFSLSLKSTKLSKIKVSALKLGYLFSGFLILLWGYIQYIFLPDTRFLSIMGWDEHYYRLISTQFDPAFTGIIFVMTFSLLTRMKSKLKINKNIFYLLCFSLMYGILLTYSRASYLSFVVLVIGSAYFRKKIRPNVIKNLFIFFLFIFLIPFLPQTTGEGVRLERTSTIQARKQVFTNSLQSLNKFEFLTGRGLFVPLSTQQDNSLPNHANLPNNIFITVFTGMGTIGLILFLLLGYKWGRVMYFKDPETLILTIALFTHSMFNNTLLQPFVFLMWVGQIVGEQNKFT